MDARRRVDLRLGRRRSGDLVDAEPAPRRPRKRRGMDDAHQRAPRTEQFLDDAAAVHEARIYHFDARRSIAPARALRCIRPRRETDREASGGPAWPAALVVPQIAIRATCVR